MKPIWQSQYPQGVPSEIDPDEFDSIVDILDRSVLKYRECPSYESMGVRISYADLDRQALAFASFLQTELGVQKGDRVAIMLPNLIQYPIALFGAMKVGATIVNVNPLYTGRELAYQLADSGATVLVVLANFAHVFQSIQDKTPVRYLILTQLGDCLGGLKGLLVNSVVKYVKKMVPPFQLPQAIQFKDILKRGAEMPCKRAALEGGDIAFLQYTGGTTGVSKGVVLTHRNIIANMQQAHAWVNLDDGKEVIITALPLYHIFSLTANCMLMTYIGGCNVLIVNPRDIPGFIKILSKVSFTIVTGVNTLFHALMKHPQFSELDFSQLKLTLGGGMAVQRVVADDWKKKTGCPLLEAYGLTEASPAVTVNPLNLSDYNGAIGLPLPSTDVKIINEEGTECAIGDIGELCVKGPQVMSEYWQKPSETALVFTEDGWLKTGDLAYADEKGYFYIASRKKDMILVSGFNVYPNEIEDVLVQHPGIREIAAIGVDDEHSGERIKCCIVKEDPNLTEDDVRVYARTVLTDYKLPRDVAFYDELPKTNVGKILHRALRDPQQ